ncbi:MAG: hypothetical protein A2Z02_06090 [Chloroflexi bacterium RBG_16_48_7]|nr:MAG: hypothetical protein A2Z02_06090 [Chloroflexi bacterium RBG_16_48_7]
MLGLIFVPLNFRAKESELSYMLRHSQAKTLLAGRRYIDMIRSIMPGLPGISHSISIDEKVEDMLFYEDLISGSGDETHGTDIGDDDVTILMYTAGTTGLPKGVPLRHS